MRTLTMIAAATVAATTPALGDTLGLGPNKGIHGAWSGSPQTLAYPARLPRGGVAVRFAASWCGTVDLVDRRHHVVQRLTFAPLDEDVDGGEMLVPAAGDYRVRVTGSRCADGLPAAGAFDLSLVRDCLGDARTVCRLEPGETRRGAQGYGDDQDWFRLDLRAGHTYDITTTGVAYWLTLLDAQGRDVADGAQRPSDCSGDGCHQVVTGFTPPASGTYFAAVGAGGRYRIDLAAR